MGGSLGDKIGEGAMADIHAWAPGQVVKLFKAGLPPFVSGHEARMTRAVFAAGLPAPEVLDEVTLDGRSGIVLARLDGPTLLELTRTGAMTSEQAGAVLATLAISVHETPPPPGLLSLSDQVGGRVLLAGDALPKTIAAGALALIERLPPQDVLSHGDLHPGNVMMTAEGPRLIDWTGAMRAPAALDLAVCHIIHAELAPEIVDAGVNAAMQAEYARLAGMTPAALTAAMAPCLPIIRILVLLGAPSPSLRERMIERVEAALRAAD